MRNTGVRLFLFLFLAITGSNNARAEDLMWGNISDRSATGQDADSPQIALSSDGTHATAVWQRYGSNSIVQSQSATISENTATWGAIVTDLSATGKSAYIPQIALSSDGTHATAVWLRYDGSNDIIQSRSGFIDSASCFVIKAINGNVVVFCL